MFPNMLGLWLLSLDTRDWRKILRRVVAEPALAPRAAVLLPASMAWKRSAPMGRPSLSANCRLSKSQ